ncbi:MAG: porin [Rhodocyclales bacterium]|nr:porin [Rhodocyclales bacterium]
MQKKLIALAVAGLVSAPVMAQSNVTVYGIVDAYVGYGKQGDNKKLVVNGGGLSGSRLGFKGTEDLGNGLKAVFTLEYSLNNDVNEGVGTGGLRARQQFVGLQGGFGFIGLGRQYSPGFGVYKYDSSMGTGWSPQSIFSSQSGSTITPNSPARVSNSINWKSNNMGGLTVNAIYGLGEKNEVDERREGDFAAVGVDYDNGPLNVGVIIHHINNGAADNKKEWLLGGGYDFGAVKLLGSYQQKKIGGLNDKIIQIGVNVPVGTTSAVQANIAKFDADAGSDFDANAFSVSYTHSLSKRTTAYAAYTLVDNKDGANFSSFVASKDAAGDKGHGLGVGIRHVF